MKWKDGFHQGIGESQARLQSMEVCSQSYWERKLMAEGTKRKAFWRLKKFKGKNGLPLSLEEEMEDWLHLQQNGDPKMVGVRRVASDEDGEMDW